MRVARADATFLGLRGFALLEKNVRIERGLASQHPVDGSAKLDRQQACSLELYCAFSRRFQHRLSLRAIRV